jgi:hypothetical protein
MAYILFMMFFVSPPAPQGKQVWSLHSTAQLDFPTFDACKEFGIRLQQRLATTGTTTMRGWCVERATGLGSFALPPPGSKPSEPLKKPSLDETEIPVPRGH